MYGIDFGTGGRVAMRATLAAIRVLRPLLPTRYRFIAPYQEWRRGSSGQVRAARRSAGIRPEETRSLRG